MPGPDNSVNSSIVDYIETMSMSTEDTLKSIYLTLEAITKGDGLMISQASLQDMARQMQVEDRRSSRTSSDNRTTQTARERRSDFDNSRSNRNDFKRSSQVNAKKFMDDLTDSMEEAFTKELFGSKNPFKDALSKPLNDFAKSLGTDINGLSKEVGKRLGQQVGNAFKNNPIGERLTQEWKGIGDALTARGTQMLKSGSSFLNDPNALSKMLNRNATSAAQQAASSSASSVTSTIERVTGEEFPPGSVIPGVDDIADMSMDAVRTVVDTADSTSTALSVVGETLPAVTGQAGSAIAEVGGQALQLATTGFPWLSVALVAGAIALDKFTDCFGPAIEGFKSFGKSLANAANRTQSQNSKNLELYKQRVKDDVESMIKAPFDILQEAANKALSTWDAVLTTVTATQGYDKAGVQTLWGSYAQRLKDEGLASVISSADMMSNLENVLKSGLSGTVAEEFAYIATVLNNAIPTQDFFQYAETYASLAANAIKNGASEQEAISTANAELESFASNLLYAGRQISGGFSTSLQNGSKLFEDAAKIALTSRTGDVTTISGVLTSVSALVGSIAPDLATDIVGNVVQAATGGNASTLTALRSMTSAGASNSAFLRALAEDPKTLFAEMFSNLANLQNMSSDNYMEVAEALSGVFGISMDAFARVDFQYLADAISKMNVNNSSLSENLALLSSGETTLTSEQQRMQQVNEYMLDEGLSYVLDNEVARSIQEHMWQEQIAREIEETKFAVELQGGALDFLQGISQTIQNILDFLNPLSWMKKAENVALTAIESAALSKDVADIVEANKVGKGNITAYKNLLTGNEDLNLIGSYSELIGLGQSAFQGTSDLLHSLTDNRTFSAVGALADVANALVGSSIGSIGKASALMGATNAGNRYYKWGTVTKSASAAAASSGDWRTSESYDAIWNAQDEIEKVAQDKVQEFLDSMSSYTSDIAAAGSSSSSASKSIVSARNASSSGFLTQSELENLVMNATADQVAGSYEDWVKSAADYGITNLGQVLSDYGLTEGEIQSKFTQSEAQATAKAEQARKLHEVQFWENVETFNNDYFPNEYLDGFLRNEYVDEFLRTEYIDEFLRTEWMLNWEVMYMTPIRDDLHQLLTDWEDYYIHHTAYTDATKSAFEDAIDLANTEKDQTGDSVLALAKALTENSNWMQENQELLKDPVVHANVLLSQILVVTEAIMQQNNGSGMNSIPTTLMGLGTGMSGTPMGGMNGGTSSYTSL